MAVKLNANYSKKLGLPGYSSHAFSASVEIEIVDLNQVATETARLYGLLQASVDNQIQQTGYLPTGSHPESNGNGNGNGHGPGRNGSNRNTSAGSGWQCTPKLSGFVLARRLRQLGAECVVMSPSQTERKPNEKIKTDKRDACNIAKMMRNGDITEVRVPPALDEAVRDVCLARTDASDDLSRAKQRLNSFLLRNGFRYSGKARWTPSHMGYLRHLTLPNPAQNIALEEYIQAIDSGIERVARLADKMKLLLVDWEWEPVVRALMACKGFQEVAAMTIISELGDLRRFDHPSKLMAFLGLVPGEHSTGSKRRQGSITKCGNSHARWMLVQCAQHFRKAPKISAALTSRQVGQPKEVKELSWRMQHRLHKRYVKLKARGKRENKVIVAIARELSAFIWELQNKLNHSIPDSR